MYIESLEYMNVGPMKKVFIDASFTNTGIPKPIIIVGENGSGKSIFLSNIVDSFYEIASKEYLNVRNKEDLSNSDAFYKVISPMEIKIGEQYLCSHIVYSKDKTQTLEYIFKSGDVSFGEANSFLKAKIHADLDWKQEINFKKNNFKSNDAKEMFENDVICYFGPDRYEKPLWQHKAYFGSNAELNLSVIEKFSKHLYTPIDVKNMSEINTKWILDLIADSRPDLTINSENKVEFLHPELYNNSNVSVRKTLEQVLSQIIGQNVYLSLNDRRTNNSRFNIRNFDTGEVVVPAFSALSTGQLAIFDLFATIVRYADFQNVGKSIATQMITGIVVIDEIELHLHANLQREILPKLMKLFPQVQFIITTHSPLFLLGMDEFYGDDSFEVYQMPNGQKIDVENFSEFQKAYEYFKQTNIYNAEIENAIAQKSSKTLVVTEGSTDWKHMKAAYTQLKDMQGNEWMPTLEFDFLEYEPKNSANEAPLKLDMGNSALVNMCTIFSKIPKERKIIFIADRDHDETNKKLGQGEKYDEIKDWGNNVYSFLIPVPANRLTTPNICIEHLYTDEEIKTEFKCEDDVTRRLYIGNEFDADGYNNTGLCCQNKSKCGCDKICIIEGSNGENIKRKFPHADEKNLALPKSIFANNILEKVPPFGTFNFTNFLPIFQNIKEIIE